MSEIVKRRRGRPPKSIEFSSPKKKYVMGKITFTGTPHTLDETVEFFKDDPSMPHTKPGIRALELRALEKIRKGLAKYGIKSLADVLDLCKSRETATRYEAE